MLPNLKMIAATSAFAISAISLPTSALAQTTNVFAPDTAGTLADGSTFTFTVTGDPFNGPVSGGIARTNLPMGEFIDQYVFTLGQTGEGSGSLTTTLSGLAGSATDVDFISATFDNGVDTFTIDITRPLGDAFEVAGASNIPIFAGNLNTLSLRYTAQGQGSYGGQLTFTPEMQAAIPEPETWALMLLGFAGVGFAMRRRKQQVRVNYAY